MHRMCLGERSLGREIYLVCCRRKSVLFAGKGSLTNVFDTRDSRDAQNGLLLMPWTILVAENGENGRISFERNRDFLPLL